MKLPLVIRLTLLSTLVFLCLNCGGGGGDSDTSTEIENSSSILEKGDLIVGLTDAEGDFTSYQVDVLSLKLFREDGAEVSVLPLASTIDFTEYVEVTELLSTTSLSKGNYVSGNMVLDYSQHDIQVEVSGNSVQANVVDVNGETIDQIEMSFTFEEDQLEIKNGTTTFLSLDFDLDSNNEVDLTQATPLVTVTPLLIAEINDEDAKEQRTRGILSSVDTDGQNFELRVRPLKTSSGSFGVLTVDVISDTLFEVDGTSYIGTAGLSAMSDLELDSLVTVTGNLNLETGLIEAYYVSAGTSVLGNAYDFMKGSVVAMSDNILSLRAGSLKRHRGNDELGGLNYVDLTGLNDLMLASDLSVVDIDQLQVGSKVVFYGDVSDVSGNRFMSNVQGGKLYESELQGSVVSVGTNSILMNLNSVNGRDSSIFEFASPEEFLVSTSILDISSVEVNDLVKIEGYFDENSNFEAISVLDVSNVDVKASISWDENLDQSPILSVSDMNAVFDINEEIIGRRHHYFQGRLKSDLLDITDSITLYSPTDMGSFTLSNSGQSTSYTSFDDFVSVLNELSQDQQIKSLSLKGEFDLNKATFTVDYMRVVIR